MVAEPDIPQRGPRPVHAVVALEQAHPAMRVVLGGPRPALVLGLSFRSFFGGRADEIGLPSPVDGVLEYRAVNADAAPVPGHLALDERVLRIWTPRLDGP